jgi:hypothetical protein
MNNPPQALGPGEGLLCASAAAFSMNQPVACGSTGFVDRGEDGASFAATGPHEPHSVVFILPPCGSRSARRPMTTPRAGHKPPQWLPSPCKMYRGSALVCCKRAQGDKHSLAAASRQRVRSGPRSARSPMTMAPADQAAVVVSSIEQAHTTSENNHPRRTKPTLL